MDKDIWYYKTLCHEIIENIESRGYNKTGIYIWLSRKLKVPEPEAHIGSMSTISQVKRALAYLNGFNSYSYHNNRMPVVVKPKRTEAEKLEKELLLVDKINKKQMAQKEGMILMRVPRKGYIAENLSELQKMANTLN